MKSHRSSSCGVLVVYCPECCYICHILSHLPVHQSPLRYFSFFEHVLQDFVLRLCAYIYVLDHVCDKNMSISKHDP